MQAWLDGLTYPANGSASWQELARSSRDVNRLWWQSSKRLYTEPSWTFPTIQSVLRTARSLFLLSRAFAVCPVWSYDAQIGIDGHDNHVGHDGERHTGAGERPSSNWHTCNTQCPLARSLERSLGSKPTSFLETAIF